MSVPVLALLLGTGVGFAEGRRGVSHPLFHGGYAPVATGGTPRGVSGSDSEACAECHADIAREWRGSLHAQSWTDEVFQAAYAVEPMAFCRNCHAPLMRQGARHPDERAAREGVSCLACHVRSGRVMGTGRGDGDAPRAGHARTAPHAVFAVRAFSQSAYCGGCHQFNFPTDVGPGREPFASDEPMQDTYEEWAMSSAAREGTQCQDCHMPYRATAQGRRYRSHAFSATRDPAMLARAVRVSVSAAREGNDVVVRAEIGPGETGHSFPTGDLFRRGELRVWLAGQDESRAQVTAFARQFANVLERAPGGAMVFVRRQRADTRVPPPGMGPPRVVTYRFTPEGDGAAAAPEVRWALDHLLMPTPQAASQGFGVARVRTRVLSGTAAVSPAASATPAPTTPRLPAATPEDPR